MYLRQLQEYQGQVQQLESLGSEINTASKNFNEFLRTRESSADERISTRQIGDSDEALLRSKDIPVSTLNNSTSASGESTAAPTSSATIKTSPQLALEALHTYIQAEKSQLDLVRFQLQIISTGNVQSFTIAISATVEDIYEELSLLQYRLQELEDDFRVEQLLSAAEDIRFLWMKIGGILRKSSAFFSADYADRLLSISREKTTTLETALASAKTAGKNVKNALVIVENLWRLVNTAESQFSLAFDAFESFSNAEADASEMLSVGRAHLAQVRKTLKEINSQYRLGRLELLLLEDQHPASPSSE